MAHTEQVNFRIDTTTKADAEAVLKRLGISASDAMRMFYNQIIIQQGIPFALKTPLVESGGMEEKEEARFMGVVKASIRDNKKVLDDLADR
jgi:addiction module RelB/DinJ family antitoxin